MRLVATIVPTRGRTSSGSTTRTARAELSGRRAGSGRNSKAATAPAGDRHQRRAAYDRSREAPSRTAAVGGDPAPLGALDPGSTSNRPTAFACQSNWPSCDACGQPDLLVELAERRLDRHELRLDLDDEQRRGWLVPGEEVDGAPLAPLRIGHLGGASASRGLEPLLGCSQQRSVTLVEDSVRLRAEARGVSSRLNVKAAATLRCVLEAHSDRAGRPPGRRSRSGRRLLDRRGPAAANDVDAEARGPAGRAWTSFTRQMLAATLLSPPQLGAVDLGRIVADQTRYVRDRGRIRRLGVRSAGRRLTHEFARTAAPVERFEARLRRSASRGDNRPNLGPETGAEHGGARAQASTLDGPRHGP